jgi:hypothetical protein
MNFEFLVNTIQDTHNKLQQNAVKAVNVHLTLRNWLVGFYIVEYEQKGEKLLDQLALKLNTKDLGSRNLKLFRQFYFAYPQIVQTLPAQLKSIGFSIDSIQKLTFLEDQNKAKQQSEIVQTPSAQFIPHQQFQVSNNLTCFKFSRA